MGIFSVLLALAVLAAGCELPDTPQKSGGAGLVILLPGAPGGADRAVTAIPNEPGTISDPAVQSLLTYKITLTKGSQKVEKTGSSGQTLEFPRLETGTWTITTNAFFQGHGNLQANDPASTAAGPQTVTLSAEETKSVAVTLDLATALENKVLIPDAETFLRIGSDWSGLTKQFLLLTDLTLDEWEGPAILGPSGYPSFFDGGGHTVTINSFKTGAGFYGLFRDASEVMISGLNIVLDIPAGPADTQLAGGLTPVASNTTITDVHVSGTLNVAATSWSGNPYAGGIVGEISGGEILSCSSKLKLKVETPAGIISTVGGIAGQLTDAGIGESFFGLGGTVEGETAGGIVGDAPNSGNSWIKHCYSAGTVQGPPGTADPITAGGIAGSFASSSSGDIFGSYFSGEVNIPTAGPGSAVGGIAGGINGYITINTCLLLDPTVSVPSGVAVHQVVGADIESSDLYHLKLLNNLTYGGTFTQIVDGEDSPINPGTHGEGETFSPSNEPPIASDYPEGMDVDYSPEFGFVMPKPGWNYIYPVFAWQIDKGIEP